MRSGLGRFRGGSCGNGNRRGRWRSPSNEAVCRISGYTQEELIGQHVRDLTHPEDRELRGPLVKRLMAGEIPSFTLEKTAYLRKDGQTLLRRRR